LEEGAISGFRTRSPSDGRQGFASCARSRSDGPVRVGIRSLRSASWDVGIRSLRTPATGRTSHVGIRFLRHESVEISSAVSDSDIVCAAALPKRLMRQSHLPFLEARISKRGADDGDVEALEVLIQSASKRGSQKRFDVSNLRPGPGDEEVGSRRVDFGGLDFIKFDMSPELAERTVIKRVGPRDLEADFHYAPIACILDGVQ